MCHDEDTAAEGPTDEGVAAEGPRVEDRRSDPTLLLTFDRKMAARTSWVPKPLSDSYPRCHHGFYRTMTARILWVPNICPSHTTVRMYTHTCIHAYMGA